MKKNISTFFWPFIAGLSICIGQAAKAQSIQSLSIKDFAIWGGSAAPGQLQTGQGVFLKGKNTINGNIGSNHLVDIMETWKITGRIYSGNKIDLEKKGQITGSILSWKSDPDFTGPAISGKEGTKFNGNLISNGKIDIKSGNGSMVTTISGQVSVPSPSASNYSGPTPSGGFIAAPGFPTLPVMPGITNFDNQVGSLNITKTRILFPGVYKNFELKGGQTITFRGPGNYVFEEIKINGNNNNLVFDLNNTTEGTINIFVKKNIQIGKIMVRAIKGNATSRIFTEVHGNGAQNNGFSFEAEARGFLPEGHFIWLGNVWAPNGGISIKGAVKMTRPHIIGALWSSTKVVVSANTVLDYDTPAETNISYIEPYYAPPVSGKVDETSNIIGAELTSLSENPNPITSIPENEIFRFDGEGKVMIEVISKSPNDNTLKQQLINLGMTDTIGNGPHSYIITGFFPIALLPQLNTNPLIEYVRPLYPPVQNRGQVTTQGDKTMKSNLVRERFGLDGSGVKIGVLSDSYNAKARAQDDIDQGDLPGVKSSGDANENPEAVQVVQDLRTGGKDEGRAMLQIVHDIAPKSTLAFRTGFLSAGDFAKGILELADPSLPGGRCDIIVDDLSYITEPFFRDGVVAQTVDQVVADGVTYFTSAGNFGKRSYEATFNGVTNTSAIPAPAQVHQFGSNPSEVYQSILLKPGTYTIVLQWDDEFHSLGDDGVETDLDLYLVGANGFTLFGFNRSNVFKDPFEVCPFVVKEETIAKLMVVRSSGNNNVRFKYIIFRGDATILDYQNGTSTIVGHANSNGAISLGAMLYDSIPGVTSVWPGVASFSSRGGTFTLQNNNFITRNKPDLIAPNGVNTTVNLGGAYFNDGDNYPNFFGTSAAAPHAAAVGALILHGRRKFNQETSVSPEIIRQQLISSAGKFAHLGNGFSFEGGNGYLQADMALLEIAHARPIIDTLMAEVPGSESSGNPFTVVVKGRYLTNSTQIYVNELPVPGTVSGDGNEVRAMVQGIPPGEDPSFQLFNAAKSPSGEDGGFSEKKYFFSEKKEVRIKANDKNRKYGQENPLLDVSVTIDGVPIADTDESLSNLLLDPALLTISTIATKQSRAGLYGIFVDRITPLPAEDPLYAQYNFIFEPGTLEIEKMPLKIIPNDKFIKYGEYPGDINYSYESDINGYWEELPAEFFDEVAQLHKAYMAENGIIVVKGFNDDRNTLTQNDLNNLSTLASFQSVLKAKKYVIQNGQLRAMVNTIDANDIGNQRFVLETPLSSMLNYVDDPSHSTLDIVSEDDMNYTGLLNLKELAKGEATASLPNGQLKAMVNGQLMGMVNGAFESAVDADLYAIVNGTFTAADDIIFQNGQLRALINGEWKPATNGQLRAMVNGNYAEFELSVVNGQLRAIVNGQEMNLVNGQLRAMVNGQEVSIANGQLRAMVNGQLVPLVNNELMGIVNGQLRALVNGQMAALVNGQLMASIDGELEEVTELTLVNGQLRALINGQLRALINGQLRAMVNAELTDIDINGLTLVNGQLRAMVNGQLRAMVNGQLKAIVNGQLRAMVNSEAIAVEKVIQLANGQLKALVNGNYIPIRNGQLRAMINGQLRAMVNGELMAEEENQINFTVFENGQLKAMVNGQLRALINGQLRAMVNGALAPVDSYVIENGQLRAMVNGEEWVFPNGQLKALINGQLKALINNFDISGTNNNAKTMVLIGEDDVLLQQGDIGGMFSMAMITGNEVGNHSIIPAAFINENFEVTYETGYLEILPAPVTISTGNATKVFGEQNPNFTGWSISGLAYDETVNLEDEEPYCDATAESNVGMYPIEFYPSLSDNYIRIEDFGNLTITPKLLTVTANNQVVNYSEEFAIPELTINYDGLVGDDTEESVCVNIITPASPKVINDYDRTVTYSNVLINGSSNVFFASPGQNLNLSGTFVSYRNPTMDCDGCVTQLHIGMGDGAGNFFSTCYEATWSGASGNLAQNFTAPTIPGIYYITQRGSWWYYCGQFTIDNHKVDDVNKFAIAVVIVTPTGAPSLDKISASVNVDDISGPGDYPITLSSCPELNPNYNVVLVNGTLSLVDPEACNLNTHLWKGDGDFVDSEDEGGVALPIGGVTATGEGRVGSNSFSFDGTGYISTQTTGSVSGTGNFTVSAWVKTTSFNPMVIIQQRDEDLEGQYILKIGGIHNEHGFNTSMAGRAYFMIFDAVNNPGVNAVISNKLVNDGAWHFIKAERIGTVINLYVDDVLDATASTPGIVNLSSTIKTFIGSDQRDNASFFNGLIDEVQVEICIPPVGITGHIETKSFVAKKAAIEIKESITSNKVFPNPATNSIRVQLTEDVVNINEIQVLSAFGKVNRTMTRKIDDGVYEVNISGIPKGIYFLKARTPGGIKTFKFVKM